MTTSAVIRTRFDRLRYIIGFEVFLLIFLVPAMAWAFDRPLWDMGLLNIILSVWAMSMNYLYNLVVDRLEAKTGRVSSDRKLRGRLLHAFGLECVLISTAAPIYMLWLHLSLLEAISVNLVVSTSVMVYTFVFTWCYDRIFPVSGASERLG
ncbi:PACE efflux transporter [Ruegeria sp.]|uniref:PACE efflux transporter n=1 Tax=Ruegeria sp. TaxID=1879320 RepID=UPI00231F3A33|nr:PACE efflux transporter [Ruegeria sp.]MDA7965377.1 PACE efflux transporter [Ruegeria sp.]